MEVLLIGFVFVGYILVRLMLGHHITQTNKDQKKFQPGIEMAAKKRYKLAIQYFDSVLEKHPKSAVAWLYKAKCNFELHNFYEAIYDCDKAANYDYSLSECYLIKGKALYILEEYQDAHDEFARAVWFYTDKAEPYRWKGLANHQMNKVKEAEADFKRAVNFDDEDANHYLLRMDAVNRIN
ncbi:MAG TPA: hypothetical protein DCS93_41250 [Microscillaceae bacterium]|nr:hypothetical protein [Microscillaceae bacterium]